MGGSRFERGHEYFVRTKDYLYGVTFLIIECMIVLFRIWINSWILVYRFKLTQL